jgi:hypothetical protein
MIKRNLLYLGLLSLGMTAMSGCAQKMAKPDNAAPSSTAEMAPSGNSTRATPEASTATALPTPLLNQPASPPATPADAGAMKDKNDAAAKQAAATAPPLPSQVVMDAINKMGHHPRVRYLSRTAQYSYYVGGRLDAVYDINKNELVVSNDNAASGGAVTCRYSNDGKMIVDKSSQSPKVVGECNDLINELMNYLSR